MLIKQVIELNKRVDPEAEENSEFEMITSDCISEMFDKLGIEGTPEHKQIVKEKLKTNQSKSKLKESDSTIKNQLSGLAGDEDSSPTKAERKDSLQTFVKSVMKQPVTPRGTDMKKKFAENEEEKAVEIPSLKCC